MNRIGCPRILMFVALKRRLLCWLPFFHRHKNPAPLAFPHFLRTFIHLQFVRNQGDKFTITKMVASPFHRFYYVSLAVFVDTFPSFISSQLLHSSFLSNDTITYIYIGFGLQNSLFTHIFCELPPASPPSFSSHYPERRLSHNCPDQRPNRRTGD